MDVWVVLVWGHGEYSCCGPLDSGLCVDTSSFSVFALPLLPKQPQWASLPDVVCSGWGGIEAQNPGLWREQGEATGIVVAAIPDPE